MMTGGGLGGAGGPLDRARPRRVGSDMQYVQGIGSFSTFDEFLRLTYGSDRWQTSTRVVYSSSSNDFRYRNYNKKMNIYDDDRNIIGTYYPVETQQERRDFHDLHVLAGGSITTPGRGDRLRIAGVVYPFAARRSDARRRLRRRHGVSQPNSANTPCAAFFRGIICRRN